MLTKADDYPIHQLPEPVATAGTDRNFYERYYFQGYDPRQAVFFGATLGIYPHLNLIDAAFMVQRDGTQHSLFASRHLECERMDTHVGPIAVEVLEPLQRLRLHVGENEHGLSADLVFAGSVVPLEEPRFTSRAGPRTVLDLTRMTQSGLWQGGIRLGNERFEVVSWRGTRDRSWGVRPIGARDPQPMVPMGQIQWFWLWAPMHFDDYLIFCHTNDDEAGRGWNRMMVLVPLDGRAPLHLRDVRFEVKYRRGTRQAASARIRALRPDGGEVHVELECGEIVYKEGEGYGHQTWGHGMYHGPDALHFETLDVRKVDSNDFAHIHLHALCKARLELPGEAARAGTAVLEQMLIGPHAPSGFREVLDPAR